MTKQPNQKLNATQRLEVIEQSIMEIKTNFEQLQLAVQRLYVGTERNMNTIVKDLQELDKKIIATVRAGSKGNINEDSVSEELMQQKEKELKNQVELFVNNNVLIVAENGTVSEDSFVVLKVLDKDGNVVDRRAQFSIPSLSTPENQPLKDLILGAKIGESVQDGNDVLQIVEVYTINKPEEKNINFESEELGEEGSQEVIGE